MFNLFTPKVQTVGTISDFLATNKGEKEGISANTITASMMALAPLTFATNAHAGYVQGKLQEKLEATLQEKITAAFDPIINLAQAVAYPVSFLMITAGFLVIMTGNRSRGFTLIKWAAIGYIGMQFLPGIMSILGEVGAAIRQ